MVIFPSDTYQKRIIIILISGKAGAGKTTVANGQLLCTTCNSTKREN